MSTKLRPDYAAIQRRRKDTRSPERLIAHYELERRLADRLRAAGRDERSRLYTEVYSELFNSLPDHPQKTAMSSRTDWIVKQVRLLKPLVRRGDVYLEVGCGDALLPFALAGFVREVLGLDVTDALVDFVAAPAGFRFLKTDGVEIPLAENSVDLAHSDQLMEHLHVEDAEAQLREIHRVLRPGGHYVCKTPSRLTGPHDISVFFDEVATGMHMREYDYGSVRSLMLQAGFRSVEFALVVSGYRLVTPPYPILRGVERALQQFPARLRCNVLARCLMGITAIAIK
ncbi:class I SAM-dependent methyltransferase [Bradyrhizobium sp. CCBAU 45389]|uniref:class I SAM-dependent methyltransferase n=1 Tax=Bradyrhizobium sp. CCBAU 45389 TaxID=858429 RepID=UPI002305D49F|nr:class I SAM-dependent methyltransferase [Bradyrhizobium sp. CCBAU 45389]MDA9397626.1 methyltransferase type 11 [Bradyrhizobium sp. CCBAU 45389]